MCALPSRPVSSAATATASSRAARVRAPAPGPAVFERVRLPRPVGCLLEAIGDELRQAEVRRLANAELLKRFAERAGIRPCPRPLDEPAPNLDAVLRGCDAIAAGKFAAMVDRINGLLDRSAQVEWWTAQLLGQLTRAQRRAAENTRLRRELARLHAQLRAQRQREEEEIEEEAEEEAEEGGEEEDADSGASSGSSSSSSSSGDGDDDDDDDDNDEETSVKREEVSDSELMPPLPEWTMTDAERLYDELRYGFRRP